MSRPLKFRAFFKADLELGQPILFEQKVIEDELYFVAKDDPEIKYVFGHLFMDEDVVIQQFTGLLDNNGVGIWEGDIVKFIQCLFNTNPDNFPIKTKTVKWDDLIGQWNVYETRAGELDVEVIGNIYQNSELITK